MRTKAKYYISVFLITAGMLSCKSRGVSKGNTGLIRILDIQLVDADTGLRPSEGAIILGSPEPLLDGPYIQEMPVERNDPNRYRVRVTWIQNNPVDQTVEIQVSGYEPYTATMEDIETVSSWKATSGQIKKTAKIRKHKDARQAVPPNGP